RLSCPPIVDLTQHLEQEDVQYVARAILLLRARARVEFLRDLFVNADAAHMRCDRQPHLGNACDSGCYQVHFERFTRTKVDLHRLPGPRFMLHRNFHAHRVRRFHLVDLWFQAEGEVIESKLQDFFEIANAFGPIADKPEIEILGGPGGTGKTQLHCHAAFEVIGVDHAAFDCLFEDAAKSKERDPSTQAFLVETLFACYTGKNLFQTLCGLRTHTAACGFWVPRAWWLS